LRLNQVLSKGGRSRQRKNTRLGGDLHVSHNKS